MRTKILRIEKCYDCKYLLVYPSHKKYCSHSKGNSMRIREPLKLHPDCPLEDADDAPQAPGTHHPSGSHD